MAANLFFFLNSQKGANILLFHIVLIFEASQFYHHFKVQLLQAKAENQP